MNENYKENKMNGDLNESDIVNILIAQTYMEHVILVKSKTEKNEKEWLAKAALVKTKLYRMRDGIQIQKDLDKETEGDTP